MKNILSVFLSTNIFVISLFFASGAKAYTPNVQLTKPFNASQLTACEDSIVFNNKTYTNCLATFTPANGSTPASTFYFTIFLVILVRERIGH